MNQERKPAWLFRIAEAPRIYWLMAACFVAYLLFFVVPVFLNNAQAMDFVKYVPASDPVGQDFRFLYDYCVAWAVNHQSPYVGLNLYPPLATILFSPLVAFDVFTAYKIVTLVTIASYVLITFLIPLFTSRGSHTFSISAFMLASGLFSFGLLFEIEKGQFNVIAIAFCLTAIYLFHYRPRLRMLAYFLFAISVQLKIYPAIFIVMFVDDWSDWKGNIKRWAGIAALNAALLFVLGYGVFTDFLLAVTQQAANPHIPFVNHSIIAFADLLTLGGGLRDFWLAQGISIDAIRTAREYIWIVKLLGYAVVFACILSTIFSTYRQRVAGFNRGLLLVCTLAALLIPPISHDYTLSILAAPMALAMQESLPKPNTRRGAILFACALALFSFAYASILFSFAFKPTLLRNNFPALVTLLITTTALSVYQNKNTAVAHG